MITIGLAGPQYSGKGEVARHLTERYDAWVWGGSSAVRHVLKAMQRHPRPFIRDDYSALTTALRDLIGDDYIFMAFARARGNLASEPRVAVHDGVRWVGMVDAHRRETDFHLLYLDAPVGVRFQRALTFTQGKGGRPPIRTIEEFMREEHLASELELPEVRGMANAVISTDEPLETTLLRIDGLMDEWLPIPT